VQFRDHHEPVAALGDIDADRVVGVGLDGVVLPIQNG
jgi:hypothetical protein